MAPDTTSAPRLSAKMIEEVALRLMGRDGFASVSMRQVAAELGVQVGALYNHVPDKQQMLARVIFAALDSVEAAWDSALSVEDIAGRIDAVLLAHLRFVLHAPEAAALPERDLQFLSADDQEQVSSRIAARRSRLEGLLRDGRDAGILKFPDAGIMATAVLSTVEGVGRWAPTSDLSEERIERITLNLVRRLMSRS